MNSKTVEFLERLKILAIECNVDIRLTPSDDVLMAPTYTTEGYLDEWFVVGVNPYRQYNFKTMTQETK